jgi:hypothetical protein
VSAADDRVAEEGREATLSDEEIETTGIGSQSPVADTGDDTGDVTDATDTGDDTGDTSDTSDTGDDTGDAADQSDTGDDSGSSGV